MNVDGGSRTPSFIFLPFPNGKCKHQQKGPFGPAFHVMA
jgi:hypothetical protein